MIDFLLKFGGVVVELNRLLGMRFIPQNPNDKSLLGLTLRNILEHHRKGEYFGRDLLFVKVLMMIKDLQEIEKYDSKLLVYFKRKMHESRSRDRYIGTRFEIHVASSLIKKKINFTKTEHPDFTLHVGPKNVFVECGSAHYLKEYGNDVFRKLSSVIKKKSEKDYCNSATTLFIDATGLYYNAELNDVNFDKITIEKQVLDDLKNSSFGSVIVFACIFNQEASRLEYNYNRIDNNTIDGVLLDFLNRFYPIRDYTITKYSIASEN